MKKNEKASPAPSKHTSSSSSKTEYASVAKVHVSKSAMDNLTEEEWLSFPEPFNELIQQERDSSIVPPDMNTISSVVRHISHAHPEMFPLSTTDVSQGYIQAPILIDDEYDLITIAEFHSDNENSYDSDDIHSTFASISLPNNHNKENQSADENSEMQQRVDLFHQIFGPPLGLWDYDTDPAEYMNPIDLNTAPTASETASSDDYSYSEQSMSDSTPILNISEILSQLSTPENDSESESTSSHDTMPPLMERN